MTEKDHTQIYDSHSTILHKLDKKIDILIKDNQNNEKKLDSLETRLDNLVGSHTGDIKDISYLIQKEMTKIENKFEKSINQINNDVSALKEFKSEINGKIYGAILGVSAVFAIVTFLLNKFISV